MSIHHCQSVSETISFCCPFLQPPLHDQAAPGDVKQALGRGNLLEEQKVRQEGQIYFFFTLPRSWREWGLSSLRSFLGVCKGDDAGKAMEEHFLSAPCMRRYHFVLIPSRANAVWGAGPCYLTPDLCINLCISTHFCYWAVHKAGDLWGECWHGFELGL